MLRSNVGGNAVARTQLPGKNGFSYALSLNRDPWRGSGSDTNHTSGQSPPPANRRPSRAHPALRPDKGNLSGVRTSTSARLGLTFGPCAESVPRSEHVTDVSRALRRPGSGVRRPCGWRGLSWAYEARLAPGKAVHPSAR